MKDLESLVLDLKMVYKKYNEMVEKSFSHDDAGKILSARIRDLITEYEENYDFLDDFPAVENNSVDEEDGGLEVELNF